MDPADNLMVWDRAAVSPLESTPKGSLSEGSAKDWGRPASEGKLVTVKTVTDGSEPSTAPKKEFFCVHASRVVVVTLMILPQVHLRKPCYDFYFL